MHRRSLQLLARRKHGQSVWSPNHSSSGAAPTNGITAQEALQIAYRPMPPENTVEYEEDFGPNMMIHREFISRKHRSRMSMGMSALAYSDIELQRAKQQLATAMNRERQGSVVGAAGSESDRVNFNADVDETTREIRSARFLFNEARMQFCDRFQTFFRQAMEQHPAGGEVSTVESGGPGEENHFFFSLMEACAVIYGCETDEARETYFERFLGLDRASLAAEAEAADRRREDVEEVERLLQSSGKRNAAQATDGGSSKSMNDMVQEVIDRLPPLFPPLTTSTAPHHPSVTVEADTSLKELAGETSSKNRHSASSTDEGGADHPDDYAPLFKAYLAHARGESPVASYDISDLRAASILSERQRWRLLMDKIVAEDYHHLTSAEMADARLLSNQLHTVKFFDLKVGDTVREIMQLLQRETGIGSSLNRDVPLETSVTHPERRV